MTNPVAHENDPQRPEAQMMMDGMQRVIERAERHPDVPYDIAYWMILAERREQERERVGIVDNKLPKREDESPWPWIPNDYLKVRIGRAEMDKVELPRKEDEAMVYHLDRIRESLTEIEKIWERLLLESKPEAGASPPPTIEEFVERLYKLAGYVDRTRGVR